MKDLNLLVDRLYRDINGMPWSDRSISPAQLKGSVEFFIKAFQNDAKNIGEQSAQKEHDPRGKESLGRKNEESPRGEKTI
jgi:hypothetical protein